MTKASVDLGEFYAENKVQGPRCGVEIICKRLDADHVTRLTAALAAPMDEIQHAAIERTVAKWGHRLGKETIKRHRSGACACGRR